MLASFVWRKNKGTREKARQKASRVCSFPRQRGGGDGQCRIQKETEGREESSKPGIRKIRMDFGHQISR